MRLPVLFLLSVTLLGCDNNSQGTPENQSMTLSDRMASKPDAGFIRAMHPRVFSFPVDHSAHEDFATEWWYFTGNLEDNAGRAFGYQFTLFRVGLESGTPKADSKWRTHQVYMGHLAISDIQNGQHESAEKFSRAALGLAGARLNPLQIWLGPWSIKSASDNVFPIQLTAQTERISINLAIGKGDKPVILQGNKGLSQKSAEPGNASYYYSYTRLPTVGTLRVNTQSYQVSGNSWFDREWSTSAMMPTPLAISMALPWAPLMPPRPEVTNKRPVKSWSAGIPSLALPAFRMVL